MINKTLFSDCYFQYNFISKNYQPGFIL